MAEEGKFIITPREIIEDTRLTMWHIKVLLALYSFRNKNTDLVYPSRESITKRCGIRPSNISKTTSELVDLGWLEKTGKGGTSTTYKVTVPDSSTVPDFSTPTVPESSTHKNTIKENPIKNPPTPQWLDLEIWDEFKKHRKKVKKPMTEFAEKKMLIKLGKLKDEGHDPNKLLEESLINGWQGVFEPKKQAQPKYLSADERARLNTSWLDEEIKKSRGEHGAENERSNTGGIKVIQ